MRMSAAVIALAAIQPGRAAAAPAPSRPVAVAAPLTPFVPGYVRAPLGRFEVTTVSDGAFMFSAPKFLTNLGALNLSKALADADLPQDYPQAINAFVVRTPARVILVDTGLGDMPAKIPALVGILGRSGYGHLLGNLRAAGFSPERVDDVLLTHLHVDHIGGLVHEGRAVFPRATVWVDKREADFWLSDAQREAHPDLAPLFTAARMALVPYRKAGRLRTFDGETTLAPGVRALPTHGHTPGHTSYLFESEGRRLIVWGDVLHVPAVQFAHPDVQMKFDVDPAAAEATRQAVLSRSAREGDLIAGAHLFFPGLGRVNRTSTGYAWIPLAYPTQ